MQYLCNPGSQLIARFPESIDDLAEVSFVDSEHLCHSVLTKATGVDSQL